MQKYLFIVCCVLSSWAHVARASSCVYPDDGNDLYIHTECPEIDWTLDGQLTIVDRGELIWADEAGRIHYERSLGDVPEPYSSMYRMGRRNAQGGLDFIEPPGRTSEGVDIASTAEQIIQARAMWRAAAAAWRSELYLSLRELLHAQMRPAPLAINPLLFAYPPGRSIVGGDAQRMLVDARARALRARHVLLVVMPEKARTLRVPPGWLRAQAVH